MNEQKKPSVTRGGILIAICSIFLLAGILFFVKEPVDITGWILIVFYVYGIWIVARRNAGRVYPFAIFLLYCFVSNAGQTLTHLSGIENTVLVDIYAAYSSELINRMLILQGVFVLCMILGYLLLRRMRAETPEVLRVTQTVKPGTVILDDLILWVLAVYVAVIYAQELSQRVDMDYGEYYYETREGLGTVAQYLYHVVVFAYLFKHPGWRRKMAFGIVLVLAGMAVLIGARSATIPVIVGVCFILSYRSEKKFKLRLWHVVAGVLILMIYSAFAELRKLPISELSFSLIMQSIFVSPLESLANILQEMGTSARTTLTTMQALDCGVVQQEGTILYSLLKGIFPLQLLNLVGIQPPAIESLSAWVSDYGSGLYVEGKGWGYSFIGEIIYNFGNWGFIFSFFFGAAIALLENGIEKLLKNKDYYLGAGVLYVLGYGVFLARAETTLLSTRIRYTVYMAVLLFLVKLFLKKRSVNSQ